MKHLFFSLIFALILATFVSAAGVNVSKTAPEKIALGDILSVNLTILNLENESQKVIVTELLGNANAIDPAPVIPIAPTNRIAARPTYFEWTLDLSPLEARMIIYKLKPTALGSYAFSPTIVRTSSHTYYSNALMTTVRCQITGVCNSTIGENHLICSENCPSGSKDDYCDGVADGKCDFDCTQEKDFDCHCGNNVCEPKLAENYQSCQKDCPSGSKDGFCNGVKDGTCDPDCTTLQDSDCSMPNLPSQTAKEQNWPLLVGIIAATILIALIVLKLLKK